MRLLVIFLAIISTSTTFAKSDWTKFTRHIAVIDDSATDGFNLMAIGDAAAESNDPEFNARRILFGDNDSDCSRLNYPALNTVQDLEAANIDPTKYTKIIKEIWNIVEGGKSKVTLNLQKADALPLGVQCWSQLSGWQRPTSKLVNINYKNKWGMKVVDFTYRITFTPGGKIAGIGNYIANISIQPADLTVLWGGFNFNVVAKIDNPFNVGTNDDPLAGVQINVGWSVDSYLWDSHQTDALFIDGKGNFNLL